MNNRGPFQNTREASAQKGAHGLDGLCFGLWKGGSGGDASQGVGAGKAGQCY